MRRTLATLALLLSAAALAGPLATVNGDPITSQDLIDEFVRRHGGHAKFLAGKNEIRRALDAMIDRRLLLQEAYNLGLQDTPEISASVRQLETDKMVDLLYRKEIDDKSKVTDAEVKAFYDTKTDVLFQVRQLVVKTKEEADKLKARALAGEDFEALVRANSLAQQSKLYGGLLANLGWGSQADSWEAAVFNLPVGGIAGPLEHKQGFELVLMVERKQVERPELAKATPRIREILERRRRDDRRAKLADELFSKWAAKMPKVTWSLDAVKAAASGKNSAELATWKDGKLTWSEFAGQLNLELVSMLPPDHQADQLENLRRELVRQRLVIQEARTRGYAKVPEIARAVRQQEEQLVEELLFGDYMLKDVTVTDAEVKAYYDAHVADFAQPERRKVAHIVVATREEADAVANALKGGESFAALAKKKSSDTQSANNGGDLGFITAKEVPPEFAVVSTMKQGEVSPPIPSKFGFHLIQVQQIVPAQPAPLEAVKEDAKKKALRAKMGEQRNFWLKRLRDDATVKVDDKEIAALAKDSAL